MLVVSLTVVGTVQYDVRAILLVTGRLGVVSVDLLVVILPADELGSMQVYYDRREGTVTIELCS